MRIYRAHCDYADNAVSSRMREQFAEALKNPKPARRISILMDISKSISKDTIQIDLPITMGQLSCSVINDKQAERLGTTRIAFYRLMRDAAISIASESSAIASSQKAEGAEGLKAVARAEEHMRLAGLCDTIMNEDLQDEQTALSRSMQKSLERLSFTTGISQDYLKNQHLYHVLMA